MTTGGSGTAHTPARHAPPAHAVPSATLSWAQPVAGAQASRVQALPSSQSRGAPPVHAQALESVSPVVQAEATALVARWAKSVECAANLVVVKTDPGNANPVGVAIDRLLWSDVVGTVAGDDTLLVVARDGVRAKAVARRIINLRGS